MTTTAEHPIKHFIAEICGIDVALVRAGGKILGYGLDSVRFIDLLLAIEKEYSIEISEDDPELRGITTVGQLIALVERRSQR